MLQKAHSTESWRPRGSTNLRNSLHIECLMCVFTYLTSLGFEVGAYLKTPRYPIWLVCSESHFSVLFGLQRELLTSQDQSLQFDLYYYDGLANQQEEIRLTVCKCVLSIRTLILCLKPQPLSFNAQSHMAGSITAVSPK